MTTPIIIAENPDYFVIDKPAGMAVEPIDRAQGKPSSHRTTVRDWMVESGRIKVGDWPENSRLGVVHRLDSDTSGLLIWAKNSEAQENLKLSWQGRQVKKTYLALVLGETNPEGEIDLPLSRDNKNKRQKVDQLETDRSRAALTTYHTLKIGEYQGEKVSLVEAHPVTGRTHQLRVHLKAIGHTIIGDELYGNKDTRRLAEKFNLTRQFLHAWKIELADAATFKADLPNDLSLVLQKVGITDFA